MVPRASTLGLQSSALFKAEVCRVQDDDVDGRVWKLSRPGEFQWQRWVRGCTSAVGVSGDQQEMRGKRVAAAAAGRERKLGWKGRAQSTFYTLEAPFAYICSTLARIT